MMSLLIKTKTLGYDKGHILLPLRNSRKCGKKEAVCPLRGRIFYAVKNRGETTYTPKYNGRVALQSKNISLLDIS